MLYCAKKNTKMLIYALKLCPYNNAPLIATYSACNSLISFISVISFSQAYSLLLYSPWQNVKRIMRLIIQLQQPQYVHAVHENKLN